MRKWNECSEQILFFIDKIVLPSLQFFDEKVTIEDRQDLQVL